MENVFTKLVAQSGDIITFNALKLAYGFKKDAFKITGDIHTGVDGSRCYFAVRISKSPTAYETIHLYGSLRFNKFKVTDGDYWSYGQKAKWSFVREFTL